MYKILWVHVKRVPLIKYVELEGTALRKLVFGEKGVKIGF